MKKNGFLIHEGTAVPVGRILSMKEQTNHGTDEEFLGPTSVKVRIHCPGKLLGEDTIWFHRCTTEELCASEKP